MLQGTTVLFFSFKFVRKNISIHSFSTIFTYFAVAFVLFSFAFFVSWFCFEFDRLVGYWFLTLVFFFFEFVRTTARESINIHYASVFRNKFVLFQFHGLLFFFFCYFNINLFELFSKERNRLNPDRPKISHFFWKMKIIKLYE